MPNTRSLGVVIDYEVIGQGEPLVLLHGFMGTRDVWQMEGWVDRMADLRLILLDARGHGRSEQPKAQHGYAPAADAADVVACLDDLGIRAAAVCGLSRGAITAVVAAARHPERLCSRLRAGLTLTVHQARLIRNRLVQARLMSDAESVG
jgi:pimeloyl-ACP methyl ester carboxylesterase